MRLFYGWVVVGAAFAVMGVGFGIPYTFAAFFRSLEEAFGAQRAELSLVFSISGFLYFSLGVVSGPLADRYGPRWVIAAGMAMVAVGIAAAGFAQSLWQVYVGYGLLVGIGVGFAYVPSIGAVQHWFVRRRGTASGLAVAGIGAGTLLFPPLAAELIMLFGWRAAYWALGGLTAVLGVGAALLIEASPARRGLQPDGAAAPPPGSAPAGPGPGLRQALATRVFWTMYVAAAICGLSIFVPFVHLAPYAQDHGLSERLGVLLFALIGVGSLLGRFLIGGAADRVGRRHAFTAMFFGMGVMLAWWWASTEAWSLAAFAVVYGVFYGGFVALAPALAADYFGGRAIGAIIGAYYSSVAIGTLVGPPLAGLAYDLWQSYTWPILGGAACNLLATCLMLTLPDPARWARRAVAPA